MTPQDFIAKYCAGLPPMIRAEVERELELCQTDLIEEVGKLLDNIVRDHAGKTPEQAINSIVSHLRQKYLKGQDRQTKQ